VRCLENTINGSPETPSHWLSGASVERWRDGLLHLIGCTAEEVAEKVKLLFEFCAEHQVCPERLIDQCRHGPDRMARRASYLNAARRTKMNLAVQSFLVHNGINVFGELICMPRTAKSIIAEQGEQWDLPSVRS
jgi:hypothetical protein